MTRFVLRVSMLALAGFTSFSALTVPGSDTARATTRTISVVTSVVPAKAAAPMRWKAMHYALSQGGKPYVYGADGPGSYDCSGLVMVAYRHAGKNLPHNTGAMLGSGKLHRVSASQVRWGDLAFFGTGHVELFAHWTNKAHTRGVTFGAHHSGTDLSYRRFSPGWSPTAFYRVS